MPAKTGGSHAISAFASLRIGSILSKYVWKFVPPLGELTTATITLLRTTTGMNLPVDEQFTGTIVVMLGLSFLWGVVYHVGRHGGGE
jgi:hypothetical protein